MTPLVWCDGGGWPMLTPEMIDHLEILSDFMAGIDYHADPNLSDASLTISGRSGRPR